MPRPRHVYMSVDLNWLIWKNAKKDVKPNQTMSVWKIKDVFKGRCTPQLQRKWLGKYLAKDDCCFSVFGSDQYENGRTVDVECANEQLREKWVRNLKLLIEWKDSRVSDKTVKVIENQMVDRPKKGRGTQEDEVSTTNRCLVFSSCVCSVK